MKWEHHISIFNKSIPICEETILGVWFHKKLGWGAHIKKLVEKVCKEINILKAIAELNWEYHPFQMTTVYKGSIRSKLDYCSFFFGNEPITLLKKTLM